MTLPKVNVLCELSIIMAGITSYGLDEDSEQCLNRLQL